MTDGTRRRGATAAKLRMISTHQDGPVQKTLLALALAVGLPAAAATPPAAPAPAPAATVATAPAAKPAVPLLWKVSDADNSVYLLGSFHLLRAADNPVSPAVEAAFADAEKVLFEITPEDLANPANVAKFAEAAKFADGRTLSQALPPETLARLKKMLEVSGTPLAQVEGTEPWALTLGMVLGMTQAMGFQPERGLDKVLMARVAEAKKPVAGLETIDAQLQALEGAPLSEQARSLDEFLADPRKAAEELGKLHAAWLAGDADLMDREYRAEMERETPVSYRVMNSDRNAAWVPQLQARLKAPGTDDTLAVVGALHLLGKDGVVERMRAKGYTVERIGVPAGTAAPAR